MTGVQTCALPISWSVLFSAFAGFEGGGVSSRAEKEPSPGTHPVRQREAVMRKPTIRVLMDVPGLGRWVARNNRAFAPLAWFAAIGVDFLT